MANFCSHPPQYRIAPNNIFLIVNIDVEMTAITITFPPLEESKSVQTHCGIVQIIDDAIGNEPDEEFFITLKSASPEGSFGDDYESHITIRDDDSK